MLIVPMPAPAVNDRLAENLLFSVQECVPDASALADT